MTKRKFFLLNLLIIAAITLNLRAPINAVGPLLDAIKEQYFLSSSMAGFLNAIPLLMFGSVSFLVGYFQNTKILLIAILAIIFGEILRAFLFTPGLFLGSFILGAGIAGANVILPAFVKKKFAQKTTFIMSLYSLLLNFSSVLGIALALPLLHFVGVSGALGFWIIFGVAALILYLPEMQNNRINRAKTRAQNSENLLKNSSVWKVTIFMGLQSFIAYSTFAWLPLIIVDKGHSLQLGTQFLLYMQLVTIPVSLIAPLILNCLQGAAKSAYMCFLCCMYLLGYALIVFGDSERFLMVSVLCMGIPMGGVFGLALIFIAQKSSSVAIAAKFSSIAQGFGYLIASFGPFAVGVLHDIFESYLPGIIVIFSAAVLLNIFGILAYRARVV